MIRKLFYVDLKKLTRGMWGLVLLGPIGIFALQAVNYGVRYDWLQTQTDDDWQQLLHQINIFLTPALLLGIALLASLIASIEHRTNGWKQLLALPVSKWRVYCSKFIVLAFLLLISTSLTYAGTFMFGSYFQWEQEVPHWLIFTNGFYPYVAALPLLTLQLWLSITYKNQGFPLMVGIGGAVISLYAYGAPTWFIWSWPFLTNPWDVPEASVLLGAIVGSIFFLISLFDFTRRDVS